MAKQRFDVRTLVAVPDLRSTERKQASAARFNSITKNEAKQTIHEQQQRQQQQRAQKRYPYFDASIGARRVELMRAAPKADARHGVAMARKAISTV